MNLTRVTISLAAGICLAQPAAKFEVASIKPVTSCDVGRNGPRLGITTTPGRLSIRCQTVDFLIRQSYVANGRDALFFGGWLFNQPIKGGPVWTTSALYAIEARAKGLPGRETMLGPMLQTLLEDRFKLRIHRETREAPIYELTVANSGPKLQAAKEGNCPPVDLEKMDPPPGTHLCGAALPSLKSPGPALVFYHATMAQIAVGLSSKLEREVIDKTGISGAFDVRMEMSVADLFPGAGGRTLTNPEDPGPSIFDAIQKLGLKLEPAKGAREFLVIDHVERPSEN